MKVKNYGKINSLMCERGTIERYIILLKSNDSPAIRIKYDRTDDSGFFTILSRKHEHNSLSEKLTAKYVEELKKALTAELAEIDKTLEDL